MSPDDRRKQKPQPQQKSGWTNALEDVLERLREGLDELARGLQPEQRQRVPIPVPSRRPSRR